MIKQGLQLYVKGGRYADLSVNKNTVTNNGTTLTTDHNGRANSGFVGGYLSVQASVAPKTVYTLSRNGCGARHI